MYYRSVIFISNYKQHVFIIISNHISSMHYRSFVSITKHALPEDELEAIVPEDGVAVVGLVGGQHPVAVVVGQSRVRRLELALGGRGGGGGGIGGEFGLGWRERVRIRVVRVGEGWRNGGKSG